MNPPIQGDKGQSQASCLGTPCQCPDAHQPDRDGKMPPRAGAPCGPTDPHPRLPDALGSHEAGNRAEVRNLLSIPAAASSPYPRDTRMKARQIAGLMACISLAAAAGCGSDGGSGPN